MRALQCLPLALLFLTSAVPTKAQGGATTEAAAAAAAAAPDAAAAASVPVIESPKDLFVFDIARQFSLNCTKLAPAEPNTIVWKKNGTEIEKWKDLENRYELKENGVVFHLNSRTYEDDFGVYTCGSRSLSGDAHAWQVVARPHAKLPPDSNVVEGQKIKLQCKLIGKPYPAVTWTFHNGSEETNATDVKLALGDRVVLQTTEQGVENGELVLEAAQRSDAGVYTCTPKDGVAASTKLRVKDMYAALWPFLGICAEVFVLCVIILLYEKRRTKPELDDSDTDNHDQKKS